MLNARDGECSPSIANVKLAARRVLMSDAQLLQMWRQRHKSLPSIMRELVQTIRISKDCMGLILHDMLDMR